MLERRRAYIEFHSRDTCTITTMYRQKTFTLKDGDVIDLVTLKRLEPVGGVFAHACPFYLEAIEVDDGRKYLMAEVYAKINPNEYHNCWGCVDLYENEKLFEGTIWS